jgi:hypothetical protein
MIIGSHSELSDDHEEDRIFFLKSFGVGGHSGSRTDVHINHGSIDSTSFEDKLGTDLHELDFAEFPETDSYGKEERRKKKEERKRVKYNVKQNRRRRKTKMSLTRNKLG